MILSMCGKSEEPIQKKLQKICQIYIITETRILIMSIVWIQNTSIHIISPEYLAAASGAVSGAGSGVCELTNQSSCAK